MKNKKVIINDVKIIFNIKRIEFIMFCLKFLELIVLLFKYFFKDLIVDKVKNFLIMNVEILVVIVVKYGNFGVVFCRRVFVFVELIILFGLRMRRNISVLRNCCFFGEVLFILFLKILLIKKNIDFLIFLNI